MKYITILIAVSGLIFLACHKKTSESPSSTNDRSTETIVKTIKISQSSESDMIKGLGVIMSENTARPSFKTGGVIKKTLVKEGDMVKKGQLLALLDMTEIDAQMQQTEVGLIKAERDMKRVKNLYADSVATLEQYQNVTSAYELAKKTVDIAKFNRNFSEVRAPITGKIVKQIMYSGEVTGPGNPIYAILGIGSSDWIIQLGLIDRDWARVEVNDEATVLIDAFPGQTYIAKVTKKSSVGGNASGTFDVELQLENQPPQLAAGLTADVNIQSLRSMEYSIIPIEALVESNGKSAYVYTVIQGKAKKVPITITKLLGDKVAIKSGADALDHVVTIGAMYLEEGQVVKVQ